MMVGLLATLFIDSCKLKATKNALKTWISSNHFDSPRKHIDGIRQKLHSLQQQLDSNLLDSDLHKKEAALTTQLEFLVGFLGEFS